MMKNAQKLTFFVNSVPRNENCNTFSLNSLAKIPQSKLVCLVCFLLKSMHRVLFPIFDYGFTLLNSIHLDLLINSRP